MPAKTYNTVQTGANTQEGGLKNGFRKPTNQGPDTSPEIKKADNKPNPRVMEKENNNLFQTIFPIFSSVRQRPPNHFGIAFDAVG